MTDFVKETHNLLYDLLRASLWGMANHISSMLAEQFSQVMTLAEEQTVAGFVFDVLKDMQIEGMKDRTPIYQAIGLSENIKQQNDIVNRELAWFVEKTDKAGLQCIVMKGQTMATQFSKPELRQSGDIDFLMQQHIGINNVFPDAGIPDMLNEKEFAFKHNGVTYELHSRLTDFGCKRHQKVWENAVSEEWNQEHYVDVNGTKVRTLSPTFNAAYLFVHLFFHLIREGISLRQFCDWAVFLHANHDKIDRRRLTGLMMKMDTLKGYKAFGCILVDKLGLPEAEFPMELDESDRQYEEKILHDVFHGGNFGKKNHCAKSSLGYKFETLRMTTRNCIRYYKLAPSEMRMMIPKMVGINVKLALG